ncbi:LuxR C-terminal-related transcriptional regulator [Streptomyces sp. NPDC005863]|uniref:LuxR C-terminal-related transcriptional regulator n=1 Tax=Streptomyces sp. NPDC005863 TaxID=3364735 RepID=UPI0036B5812F
MTPPPRLTSHERTVLQYVADGYAHKEIAEELAVTRRAVTATVTRAMEKIGALNSPHAVLLGCRLGLIDGRPRHPTPEPRQRGPVRQPLTPRQIDVLTAADGAKTLTEIAGRLGTTRHQVASRLSEAYIRLDIDWMPRADRRHAAIRIARKRGLIPAAAKDSA